MAKTRRNAVSPGQRDVGPVAPAMAIAFVAGRAALLDRVFHGADRERLVRHDVLRVAASAVQRVNFVFVVVEETPYVPPYPGDNVVQSPGFRCLVVDGEFVTGHIRERTVTPAGSHFVCAAGSDIANDSVRFPTEE